VAQWQRSRFV